jgi:hypothetical protein
MSHTFRMKHKLEGECWWVRIPPEIVACLGVEKPDFFNARFEHYGHRLEVTPETEPIPPECPQTEPASIQE